MRNLGDRIKRYEKTFSHTALKRMPLIIRVDGRAFHTFTKDLNKPFDTDFMGAMVMAAYTVAKDMQGFKAAYIQSDEVTFCLTDYDTLEAEGWFDYKLAKMISISAALMSVAFNYHFDTDKMPIFDSRAFTVPKDDIINTFLWRAKDWSRNSLQMYCRSFFSHAELHRKKQIDMHEMLHTVDKNWTADLSQQERNGTFLTKTEFGIMSHTDILPTHTDISSLLNELFISTED